VIRKGENKLLSAAAKMLPKKEIRSKAGELFSRKDEADERFETVNCLAKRLR
jgi:hypothetical protein